MFVNKTVYRVRIAELATTVMSVKGNHPMEERFSVWFAFVAHKSLLVINAKSIFIHINSSISNKSV